MNDRFKTFLLAYGGALFLLAVFLLVTNTGSGAFRLGVVLSGIIVTVWSWSIRRVTLADDDPGTRRGTKTP